MYYLIFLLVVESVYPDAQNNFPKGIFVGQPRDFQRPMKNSEERVIINTTEGVRGTFIDHQNITDYETSTYYGTPTTGSNEKEELETWVVITITITVSVVLVVAILICVIVICRPNVCKDMCQGNNCCNHCCSCFKSDELPSDDELPSEDVLQPAVSMTNIFIMNSPE